MYNQGSDHQKTRPNYPRPDNLVSRHDPALQRHPSEGGFYPPPQPGRASYPPSQPRGGGYLPPDAYPSFPVHQQPENTVHNTNTTVVIQQQPSAVIVQGQRDWSTGMCACFDDCGVCMLGWLCPCILQCMVSSKADECCCVAAACPIALRTKIRTRHNIVGSIVGDYYALQCCGICALCQMAREVNLHGI